MLNLERLQELLQNFCQMTGFAVGLVEPKSQKPLLEIDRREICRKFHCRVSEPAATCHVSCQACQADLTGAGGFRIAQCTFGLVSGCTAIVVRGRHLANLIVGQVFLAAPDLSAFKRHAQFYNYDDESYLDCVKDIPVVDVERFEAALKFLGGTIGLSATTGLANDLRHTIVLEKEKQFSLVLDSVPVGIGLIVDRTIQWVNERMIEMFGYCRTELIGKSARLLYPSDEEYEWVGQEKYRQIAQNGTGTVDTRLRAKDGSIIDVELRSTPLDGNNLSDGVLFSVMDVSARKKSEKILSIRLHLLKFSATHSVAELLREFLDEVGIITGCQTGFFYFVEPDQKTLSLQALSTQTLLAPSGNEIALECLRQRKPVISAKESLPDLKPRLSGDPSTAWCGLTVPVFREQSIVAIIGIGNKATDSTLPDTMIVSMLADIVWDIVQHHRTIDQLRFSEEKYREIFNNMSSGVAIYSAVDDGKDFIFDDLNGSGQAITGVHLADVVGKKVTLKFPDIVGMGLLSAMKRVWKTDHSESLLDLKYHDEKLLLHVDNYICKLSSGQLAVIFNDISARKKFEDEIVRSKNEWESTFDAMDDIVTIQDRHLKIVRANKAAHRFFAAEYGNLNGRHCYEVFRGSEVPCSGCPLLETLENAVSHSETVAHEKLNKTFQVSSAPLKTHDGKQHYLVHVARDITDQERLREEANRSHRLASLGELAAGVAHEINNPNGSILYNSDMLRMVVNDLLPYLDERLPEKQGERFGGLSWEEIVESFPVLLTDTYQAALRIKRIVADLRDFSRIDSESQDEPVNLNQVALSVGRLARNTINKSTDHFSFALAEVLPPVSGDSTKLEQVVLNLVLNACQALDSSEQKISITTVFKPELEQVWLQVCDEGQGIPPALINHILDPFVTTKRERGGTGLGLSVSARIVKEHRGRLKFTSTPGEGTTATLEFPAEGAV